MPDRAHIGLDNTAFRGRLRQPPRRAQSFRADVSPRPFARPASLPIPASHPVQLKMAPQVAPKATVPIIKPQPFARPARPKQQRTEVLHRQVVRPPAGAHKTAMKPRRPRTQMALVGMAVFIFFVGLFVSLSTLQTNKSAKAQVSALSQKAATTGSNDNAPPSEIKPPTPAASGGYSVAPDAPKVLKIPKIDVNAYIKPLGVKSNNELQAPNNIYDVGWYSASARPGDAGSNGAMLFDGHVHGPTLPGVFANLTKLKGGDEITIVRGDNKTFTYVVVKVQNYDASNLNMGIALTSIQPGEAALNLMTCGGPYDKVSGEYTQRTIVFAVLKI